jgi:hypothetical protein
MWEKKNSIYRHLVLIPVILATWEAEIRRVMIQGQLGQIVHEIPISKITRAKWTGGVAQAVERLLCKCKALSSNPGPTKNSNTSITPTMHCYHYKYFPDTLKSH